MHSRAEVKKTIVLPWFIRILRVKWWRWFKKRVLNSLVTPSSELALLHILLSAILVKTSRGKRYSLKRPYLKNTKLLMFVIARPLCPCYRMGIALLSFFQEHFQEHWFQVLIPRFCKWGSIFVWPSYFSLMQSYRLRSKNIQSNRNKLDTLSAIC